MRVPSPSGEGKGEGERDAANPNGRTNSASSARPAPLPKVVITSSAEPVDGGSARGRKRMVFRVWLPPHPALSLGEGESPAALSPIQRLSTRRSAGCGVPSPCGRGQG